MAYLFAEVAVFGGIDKTLHYRVPPEISRKARPGARVLVPLGSRKTTGLLLSTSSFSPDLTESIVVRPIVAVLDPDPVMPPALIELCRWISRYYFFPLGEVLHTALPTGIQSSPKMVKSVRLAAPVEAFHLENNDNLLRLVKLIEDAGGSVPLRNLRHNVKNHAYWIRKLKLRGLVRIEEVEEIRECDHRQSISPIAKPELTPDQKKVFETIAPFFAVPRFQPFLITGVTGSGKTEVYIRLAEEALGHDRGSLILVPEIALSTQMEVLFRQRFGSSLAVWHSGLSQGTRNEQWREILNGKRRVVLGVRSAVFMPVFNLGIIVVDEEHDSSYKQDDHLRYNARDVSLVRAKLENIPIVLGSATPSLQSIYHCQSRRYRQLELPRRIHDRPMPDIEVVDMRREKGRSPILSNILKDSLVETIHDDQQALLFLNRRGFANFLMCSVCGHVLQCSNCSVSLTYHQKVDRLRCHYCGYESTPPEACPACRQSSLVRRGFGTERIEHEVRRILPEATIVRIDRDTVNCSRDLVEHLEALRNSHANVLIGTQMVAKGHDFPNITLVGVVNADTALQIPDFRSGEITVQLLMQVAGRAGRGEMPGRVILQTYNPSHYTIQSVLKKDYPAFCSRELASRKELKYPPFSRLSKLLVTGPKEVVTEEAARRLAELCRVTAEELQASNRHVAVLGPSPAPLAKLKNRYRWHIFAKAWTSENLQEFIEIVLHKSKDSGWPSRVQIAVDRDPVSSM